MKRVVIAILIIAAVGASVFLLGNRRQPVNVVLVVFDTCRADHIGCYGHTAASTPAVDRLAADGVLFEHAYAQVPLTLPSHTTLFTGTYPEFHRIRDNASYTVPDDRITLAEILADHGYTTAAFVGAFPLDARFNLDQGFETYDGHFPLDSERSADQVNAAVETWIARETAGSGNGPYFIFLHYFDPHIRYLPPPPFSERFQDEPYAGEIAYADFCLAAIREKLERLCPRDHTLWIFTADHGEGLWDHGEQDHGIFLYDSTIRVPLVWAFPGRLPRGRRVESIAELADVTPTLLDLLDIEPPTEVQGHSLMPDLLGKTAHEEPRHAHAETYFPRLRHEWSGLRSLRTAEWLYIAAPREELYDLAADPGQTRNVIDQHPDIAAGLRSELSEDVRRFAAAAQEPRPVTSIDPETEARLLSLGYLGRVSNTIADPALEDSLLTGPDPKDRIGAMVYLDRARGRMEAEDWPAAEDELRRALAIAPRFMESRRLLATTLDHRGKSLEAAEVWRGLADEYPDDALFHMFLARSLESAGRCSGAIEAYRSTVPLVPDPSRAQAELVLALARMGKRSEYDAERRRFLEMRPLSPVTICHLASQLPETRFPSEGRLLLGECIRLFPGYPDAYNALAWELIESGADVTRGVGLAERAVELDPSEAAFRDTLGWGYYKQGRAPEAVVVLRKAAEEFFVPEIAHHLALALLKTRHRDEAETQLQLIVDRAPDYDRIDDVLNLLERPPE